MAKKKKNENILHVDLTHKEKSHGEQARELELKARALREKRKAYLENRDLKKAELSQEEIKELIATFERYNTFEFQIQSILIEMLKYPIPELSTAAEKFINENINSSLSSMSLWLNMFQRLFLPNNALRLLIKHAGILKENGGSIVFPREIQKHKKLEEERLKAAEALADPDLKTKQVKRVLDRIELFTKLETIYG